MLQTIKTAGKFTALLVGVGFGYAVQATTVFEDSFEKLPCGTSQVIVGGQCTHLTISDIKPLAVANNQVANFTITGKQLPNDLDVYIEGCINGKVLQRSSGMIRYQCKPTVAGEKGLVLAQQKKLVFAHKMMVSNSSNQAISLPVAPGNPNQTLTGKDSNNNGVRDEVEIALANYVTSVDLYQKALVTAKAYQQILEKPTPTNRTQALELMSELTCQLPKGLRIKNTGSNVYTSVTFNTAERKAKYRAFFDSLEGGYLGFELTPCKNISSRSFYPRKLGFDVENTGSYYNSNTKQVMLFVPGIGNSMDDAIESSDELAKALGDNIGKRNLAYTFFNNTTQLILGDAIELQYQAIISNEALKKAGLSSPHNMTRVEKQKYYRELGKMYAEPQKMPNLESYQWFKQAAKSRIIKTTTKLAKDIERILTDNSWPFETLVLVPHSQGNFYVEAAYALLYYKQKESILKRVAVYGIAPVSASTPNNSYILSNIDYVVRGLQSTVAKLFTYKDDVYDHLAVNTGSNYAKECDGFDKLGASMLIFQVGGKCFFKAGGHNLINIYLNKFITNGYLGYPDIIKNKILNNMGWLKNLYIDNKITTSFSNPEIKIGVKNDLIVKLNQIEGINQRKNIATVKAKINGLTYRLEYDAYKKSWLLSDYIFDKKDNNIDVIVTYIVQKDVIVPLTVNKKNISVQASVLTVTSPTDNAKLPANQAITLTGTAHSGAFLTVDLVSNMATGTICSQTVSGKLWSCVIPANLVKAGELLTITATTGLFKETITIKVEDKTFVLINSPINNTTLPANQAIAVNGTATPGLSIIVSGSNQSGYQNACSAITNSSGNWSCQMPANFAVPASTLQIKAWAEGAGEQSITVNIKVATTPSTVSVIKLNDTGITRCQGSGGISDRAIYDCLAKKDNWGNALPQGQDGHYSTGINNTYGMSFTKIYDGQCVKDNQTGLLWEVKTKDGSLRDRQNTYTWYDPANQAGTLGVKNGGTCSGSDCDTAAFVAKVNSLGLCGYYTGWRLPTVEELRSIIHYQKAYPDPAIDLKYFINTPLRSNYKQIRYWSSRQFSGYDESAWVVDFNFGSDTYERKSNAKFIRLVHDN